MAIESLSTFTKPARQRWESIPADIRQRLLSNVWCAQKRLDWLFPMRRRSCKGEAAIPLHPPWIHRPGSSVLCATGSQAWRNDHFWGWSCRQDLHLPQSAC